MQMKKFVLKLDIYDDKDKRKALKTVSSLSGIDSISVDMKGKKLTVIGTVDPVSAVSKLRKFWQTELISVGPAKEPEKEKKEEPKKEEPKKEEPKKEEPKEEPKKEEPKKEEPKEEPKKEEPKKEEPKKEEPKKEEQEKKEEKKAEAEPPVIGMVMPYRPYYPPVNTYYHHSIEENPNACVIC